MNLRIHSLLLVTLILSGCHRPSNTVTPTSGSSSDQARREETKPQARPETGFDQTKAFDHVKAQVDFGPRPAGSQALEKTRQYLLSQLKSYGLKPRLDQFVAVTPKGRVTMKNIIAEIPGREAETIIIASHFDTKEFREFEFVGANDGGSSTGVLLELGRVLAGKNISERRLTIQLVFFDGEEAFCQEWSECLEGNDNTYGSRHLAEQITKSGQVERYRAMILLDMVGDRNLAIPREENSSPTLVNAIWQTARELGLSPHFPNRTHWMTDDHLPFLKAGIPAVDLIDFDYGDEMESYWHTSKDTLDKIDPQSLKIVGDVVLTSLPRIEALNRP